MCFSRSSASARGTTRTTTLEKLADKGNGNYAYIDTFREAKKILVQTRSSGTLVTIAKDVKIQVEFNTEPGSKAYRLIGYENRRLKDEDFTNDKKDAGDVGAGHRVTALYEWVPSETHKEGDTFMEVRVRFKDPAKGIDPASEGFAVAAKDDGLRTERATVDMRLASAVATFGLALRHSDKAPGASYALADELARSAMGDDARGLRGELVELIAKAQALDPAARTQGAQVSAR